MRKENSSNAINERIIQENCGTAVMLGLISGRWKLTILWQLFEGPRRYSDIRKQIPQVTERILTMQLRELEVDGLVKRMEYGGFPPRVEYELSELGLSMKPLLKQIEEWGNNYKELNHSLP